MALDENQQALDILSSISSKGDTGVNVGDIASYTPQNLTPQQQQTFQSQYQPQIQPLPVNQYYPDVNHQIGVGNYSGSEIGSTTLFAPGGGLVPLGLMDARDAAVQQAAMKKAKDIEDFNKQFVSPTTKHVSVQKNLTDQYYGGLQQWQQNALKKAGGNQAMANQILKQDPNFNQWNKSMQDTAKFHDAIVEHSAQLHADEKDPNFVMDPALKQQQARLMSGLAYQGDPFSKEGQRIGKDFLATQALYDLDKSVNVALDKTLPTVEELPLTFQSRGKNELATEIKKTFYTPEAKKELAHNIFMEKYQGTGITEDQVLKNIDAKLGEKIERKMTHYDKWFKPDAKPEVDYSNVTETTSRFNVDTGEGVKEAHMQSFIPLAAKDEKMEISFPINKGTKSLGTPEFQDKTGSFTGTVSGFGIAYRDRATGKISTLTPDEVAQQKANKTFNHNMEAIPVALVNKKGTVAPLPASQIKQLENPLQVSDGEGGVRTETEEEVQQRVNSAIAQHNAAQEGKLNKLVPVPIEQVEGKYSKKSGQKVSVDDKIKEIRQKTVSENEQAAQEAKEYRETLKNNPEELKKYKEKLFDYKKEDIKKSAKAEEKTTASGVKWK